MLYYEGIAITPTEKFSFKLILESTDLDNIFVNLATIGFEFFDLGDVTIVPDHVKVEINETSISIIDEIEKIELHMNIVQSPQ